MEITEKIILGMEEKNVTEITLNVSKGVICGNRATSRLQNSIGNKHSHFKKLVHFSNTIFLT